MSFPMPCSIAQMPSPPGSWVYRSGRCLLCIANLGEVFLARDEWSNLAEIVWKIMQPGVFNRHSPTVHLLDLHLLPTKLNFWSVDVEQLPTLPVDGRHLENVHQYVQSPVGTCIIGASTSALIFDRHQICWWNPHNFGEFQLLGSDFLWFTRFLRHQLPGGSSPSGDEVFSNGWSPRSNATVQLGCWWPWLVDGFIVSHGYDILMM
jgi:hypothetical protein